MKPILGQRTAPAVCSTLGITAFLLVAALSHAAHSAPTGTDALPFTVYYPAWIDWNKESLQRNLANLADQVGPNGIIYIGFFAPDPYQGIIIPGRKGVPGQSGYEPGTTFLTKELVWETKNYLNSIGKPVKLVLAIGGWTYSNPDASVKFSGDYFAALEPNGITAEWAQKTWNFVSEWGFDGLDVDYEPATQATNGYGKDGLLSKVIRALAYHMPAQLSEKLSVTIMADYNRVTPFLDQPDMRNQPKIRRTNLMLYDGGAFEEYDPRVVAKKFVDRYPFNMGEFGFGVEIQVQAGDKAFHDPEVVGCLAAWARNHGFGEVFAWAYNPSEYIGPGTLRYYATRIKDALHKTLPAKGKCPNVDIGQICTSAAPKTPFALPKLPTTH